MTHRKHFVLLPLATCIAVAALLLCAPSASAQDAPPAATPTPAPIVRPPAKPTPIHLSNAYPVQQNPDGTNRLVKPATPATTATPSATTAAAPASATTTPAAPSAPKPQPQPQPQPPAPLNPAAVAGYLTLLPAAPFNRATVLIDAAHGGGDSGARIADSIAEKDIDLALAFRIKSLLSARGFNVVTTRDSDDASEPANPGTPLTLDDRAGIANRAFASACILIHSTGSGHGVHLYTSELEPTAGQPLPTPWLTAQAAWVTQSQRLATELGTALNRARVSLVTSRGSIRPVDSLTCPALVLELAPNDSDANSINDSGYQQRVAEAVAGALVFWQNHVQPPQRILPTPPAAKDASADKSTDSSSGDQP